MSRCISSGFLFGVAHVPRRDARHAHLLEIVLLMLQDDLLAAILGFAAGVEAPADETDEQNSDDDFSESFHDNLPFRPHDGGQQIKYSGCRSLGRHVLDEPMTCREPEQIILRLLG